MPDFEGEDPTAATRRAIGDAVTPGRPDPTPATARAIDTAITWARSAMVAQLETVNARIEGMETESRVARQGIFDVVTQRLDDIDRANVVLNENVNRVPTQLQLAVATLKELEDVKFAAQQRAANDSSAGIDARFELLDKQTVREKAAADLALAAAFDAQKEAAASQNQANSEAIRKSELATAETIKTNAEVVRTGNQSLADKIDDVKDRMNRLESLIVAVQTERSSAHDNRIEHRADSSLNWQTVSVVVALVAIAIGVLLAVKP